MKAYDSVGHITMFSILGDYGVDNLTTTFIEQTGRNSKVKCMGEVSEPFQIYTEVR